ncbi:MAG: tRNA pseudouridine(55) synthase TruB [Alphaproteobacteria bacterium]
MCSCRANGDFLGIGQLHESGLLAAKRLLRTD